MKRIKIKLNTKLIQLVMNKRYKKENSKTFGGTRARHTANERRPN